MIDFTVANWRKSIMLIVILMTYSDLEKRNIKILKKNNTLAREPTLSKNPMEPSFGEMLTFPWWRGGSSPMTAWRRSQCSAVKALFSTKTTEKRSVADPARTRTWNPLIRSQMPYPSGHGAFPRIKAIVKAKKLHSEFWKLTPNPNKVARDWIELSRNASWVVVVLPPSCTWKRNFYCDSLNPIKIYMVQ